MPFLFILTFYLGGLVASMGRSFRSYRENKFFEEYGFYDLPIPVKLRWGWLVFKNEGLLWFLRVA